MLDNRIRNTIEKAKDENAVTSDWAGPAGAAGTAVGGAVFASTGIPIPVLGPAVAKAVGKGQTKKEHDLCTKLYQFFPMYEDKRTDHWRKLFVEVLTETFINYNVVLCSLLKCPTNGPELAMCKMAEDLVNRIFNFLEVESKTMENIVNLDASLMVKGILNGESEWRLKDKVKRSEGGGTIKTKEKDYKTANLFEKCDVVFNQEDVVSKKSDKSIHPVITLPLRIPLAGR